MEKEYNREFCSLVSERRWVGADYAGKPPFPKAADFRTEKVEQQRTPGKVFFKFPG
ncbi:hypothetical protein JVX98_13545 [Ensifer sp. PDNC004]|uniref:hypothetical protein n=1 Tax=Ensifer sp. PDNC004 TaxID=2811423 RepID=UPI001963266E|nr:hypothetical protein [Ensifer sp. PDNC004]QRY69238.1 hypothetical protein JVX98_13545 [Ensifer sp. PDNC004]